jgi:hypothetical protein
MELLARAKITEEESKVLMTANEIIIRANQKVKKTTDTAVKLRLIFENNVVKSHVVV